MRETVIPKSPKLGIQPVTLHGFFFFQSYLDKKDLRCHIERFGFGQAKFDEGGSILGSSQFTLLLQLTQKMMHNLKRSKLTQK